jgi:hypothetical protein
MYVDKLDGKVDGAFFDRVSAEWGAEQDRCLGEIQRHGVADQSYLAEGVQLLELAQNAQLIVRQTRTTRKTPPAQLHSFELHLEGWGVGCQFAATLWPVSRNNRHRHSSCSREQAKFGKK